MTFERIYDKDGNFDLINIDQILTINRVRNNFFEITFAWKYQDIVIDEIVFKNMSKGKLYKIFFKGEK